jgi:Fe-S cluster assembly ATPase SufC
MIKGELVKVGGPELAILIEKEGYKGFEEK